ncbi:MAG: ABC transporter substrate-binding protein [Planctomycetota bacterium]|nr:ABC transporter substrate-binding protein [Planctomycetota bacterium]
MAAKRKSAAKKKAAPKKKAAAAEAAATKPAGKKAAAATEEPAVDLAAAVLAAIAAGEGEAPAEITLPPMPKMPARRKDGVITLAYGAECDQAFMVYALGAEKVETEDRRYELVRADMQDLEQSAEKVQYDVTTVSFGAYPRLRDRYLILPCGGAYGDHQGPVLVARRPVRTEEIRGLEVGVPGAESAASLALRLWLPKAELALTSMTTREISLRVRANHIRSGLLVNEDLLTYKNFNMVRVVDLGHWWGDRTEGLPLALNAQVVRRDIPADLRGKIALDLKRSIAYALGHREEALDWAASFAGKVGRETLDRYVQRYVNDLSLDCGERGRQAVRKLYAEAHRRGFLPEAYEPVYHGDDVD